MDQRAPVHAPIGACQIKSHLCCSVLALKHEVSETQNDLGNQTEMSLPAPGEKFTLSDPELVDPVLVFTEIQPV